MAGKMGIFCTLQAPSLQHPSSSGLLETLPDTLARRATQKSRPRFVLRAAHECSKFAQHLTRGRAPSRPGQNLATTAQTLSYTSKTHLQPLDDQYSRLRCRSTSDGARPSSGRGRCGANFDSQACVCGQNAYHTCRSLVQHFGWDLGWARRGARICSRCGAFGFSRAVRLGTGCAARELTTSERNGARAFAQPPRRAHSALPLGAYTLSALTNTLGLVVS